MKVVGKNNYVQIALGSGQTDAAIDALTKATRDGTWLTLKNLHLVIYWLPDLEKQLDNFRLFLTTEPHPSFPSVLLQSPLKSYMNPLQVLNKIYYVHMNHGNQHISQKDPSHEQVLFVLAWFHAVVQERRTHIPQGNHNTNTSHATTTLHTHHKMQKHKHTHTQRT